MGAGIIISAVAAIYGAIQQSQAQEAAAKQSEYDAEFEAQQNAMLAEQERLDREAARKTQARVAQEEKQRRISMMVRAGGGVGVSALAELSRQASIDEINIQNANALSSQKRRAMGRSATNALIAGRARSGAFKSAARSTLVSGIGPAIGSVAEGYEVEQRKKKANLGKKY